ncbi:hypothetical protein EJ06DRAFT_519404 [Trichodelitschia bisporula]|uniref:Uncharacterized protein n=1 Tax=Trichodelitschia bisporula TaxID=703511 RepID=A0A6G1I6B7_9PEZI|nr:hypothetical protein EJ06DRAFT_519404 [Trichodelitschia bisporula]
MSTRTHTSLTPRAPKKHQIRIRSAPHHHMRPTPVLLETVTPIYFDIAPPKDYPFTLPRHRAPKPKLKVTRFDDKPTIIGYGGFAVEFLPEIWGAETAPFIAHTDADYIDYQRRKALKALDGGTLTPPPTPRLEKIVLAKDKAGRPRSRSENDICFMPHDMGWSMSGRPGSAKKRLSLKSNTSCLDLTQRFADDGKGNAENIDKKRITALVRKIILGEPFDED